MKAQVGMRVLQHQNTLVCFQSRLSTVFLTKLILFTLLPMRTITAAQLFQFCNCSPENVRKGPEVFFPKLLLMSSSVQLCGKSTRFGTLCWADTAVCTSSANQPQPGNQTSAKSQLCPVKAQSQSGKRSKGSGRQWGVHQASSKPISTFGSVQLLLWLFFTTSWDEKTITSFRLLSTCPPERTPPTSAKAPVATHDLQDLC